MVSLPYRGCVLFASGVLFDPFGCDVCEGDEDEQGNCGGEVVDDVTDEDDDDAVFCEGLDGLAVHGVPLLCVLVPFMYPVYSMGDSRASVVRGSFDFSWAGSLGTKLLGGFVPGFIPWWFEVPL